MALHPLYVALAAGGTAGHINPALALAEELVDRGHEVEFFGHKGRLESRLVPEAGFALTELEISGFLRSKPWTVLTAYLQIHTAKRHLIQQFRTGRRPDVAIGFGAYIELPLLLACKALHIPFYIHEQNSYPGLANKLMASSAVGIALAFPAAESYFAKALRTGVSCELIGNPVRTQIITADRTDARAGLGVSDDTCVVVAFGGSLGAQSINDLMIRMKQDFLARDVMVVQATGAGDFTRSREALALSEEEEKRWQLLEYVSDMGSVLSAADLVIARSGASTIAELIATKKPAVLVPYPEATEHHQHSNAQFLVQAGAALMVEDEALADEATRAGICDLLDNASKRHELVAGYEVLSSSPAAQLLADRLEVAAVASLSETA